MFNHLFMTAQSLQGVLEIMGRNGVFLPRESTPLAEPHLLTRAWHRQRQISLQLLLVLLPLEALVPHIGINLQIPGVDTNWG